MQCPNGRADATGPGIKAVTGAPVAAMVALLLAWTPAGAEPAVSGIRYDLPPGIDWARVTDEPANASRRRAWIPSGATGESTPWLITEDRLDIDRGTDPGELVEAAFGSAAANCTDFKTSGPDTIRTGGLATAWGRVICARHRDKDYGYFADHRVVVDGTVAFVLTSEIRTPPSPMAGALTFGDDAPDRRAAEFFQRLEASDVMTKESFRLCRDGSCD